MDKISNHSKSVQVRSQMQGSTSQQVGGDLDLHLQSVLQNAKQKIAILNAEIGDLKKENESLTELLEEGEQKKQETISKTHELTEELKNMQSHNTELVKQKAEIQQDLKLSKEELARLLDDAEKAQNDLRNQIKKLVDEDKKVKNEITKQRTMFDEQHNKDVERFERLKESLMMKDQAVQRLRDELEGFGHRDIARFQNLEEEVKELREMADTK